MFLGRFLQLYYKDGTTLGIVAGQLSSLPIMDLVVLVKYQDREIICHAKGFPAVSVVIVVSTSLVDCMERLKMTCYMLIGT